tara:strand:- start:166 stop:444 length:279 start_codon:yes stop_codon:yes gene_type:complete
MSYTQFTKREDAMEHQDKYGSIWTNSKLPIPEVGEEVYVCMNTIGWAKVLGYFVDSNYMGLVTKPIAPPKWYIEEDYDTTVHVFGTEINELK